MLCQVIKNFEAHCATRLQTGLRIAANTRLLYPSSRLKSAIKEPTITELLLTEVEEAKLNSIKVFMPPEKHTGADVEIHVVFESGYWIGLLLQAKKADVDDTGDPKFYHFTELGYPGDTGGQNRKLIQYSLSNKLLPLYVFYLPDELVQSVEGSQYSGAMICAAHALKYFISDADYEARKILRRCIPLHVLLCAINDEGRFRSIMASLFSELPDDVVVPIYRAPPPEAVLQFFSSGKQVSRWRRDELAGAIVANLE